MKDIGERFKETRENMDISLEEASEDLKISLNDIKNLEEGNIENFKDVTILKTLIREYSKYLGLDKDEMIDEFNEYLFDYTSRISLEEIMNAKKSIDEEERIKSPYTIEHKNRTFLSNLFLVIIVLVLLLFIVYFVYKLING